MKIHNDINRLGEIKVSRFCHLKSLHLDREITENGYSGCKIEMCLCSAENTELACLNLQFLGATDIKINDVEGMFAILIEINDISSWQREGINFSVSDSENDTFSFCCADFFAVVGH
jgi:hypothetical protein